LTDRPLDRLLLTDRLTDQLDQPLNQPA